MLALAVLAASSLALAARSEPLATPVRAAGQAADRGEPVVLVGAGDITRCEGDGAERTARLLDDIPGVVFTLGDNTQGDSLPHEWDCYDATWGRHLWRTRPAVGNHEYHQADAAPHFRYFGHLAGSIRRGYYSYSAGAWHVVVLNSMCHGAGGCGPNSPQLRWLRDDLRRAQAQCILAYWHHPVFSSGGQGPSRGIRQYVDVLYEFGADVVLQGHDHNYERFAPQAPDGTLDLQRGIRHFTAGTGGDPQLPFGLVRSNSEVRHVGTFGVLKLSLYPGSYDWEFIAVEGKSFTDAGSGACH